MAGVAGSRGCAKLSRFQSIDQRMRRRLQRPLSPAADMPPHMPWAAMGSDEQWERIEPHLPTDVRGVERADDRRVISGIVHVLKSGCRWCDCPPEYGPPTTIYNRFVRWARRGIWENLFRELAGNGRSTDTQMIDSTHVKAHRSALGGKGGSTSRLLAVRAEGATRRSTHSQMLKGGSSPSC